MLQRYKSILSAIRDLCPTAHIGGGAVRDSLLERPIRDVDLFLDEFATDEAATLLRSQVRLRQSRRMEELRDVLRSRRGAGGQVRKGRRDHPGLPDRTAPRVRKRGRCKRTSPASTSEFAWRGGTVARSTPRRNTSATSSSKTFTLCRADDQAQFTYSMSRFDKMTADRYAGWRLVVPREIRGDGERARAQKDPLLQLRCRCVDAARSRRAATADA